MDYKAQNERFMNTGFASGVTVVVFFIQGTIDFKVSFFYCQP